MLPPSRTTRASRRSWHPDDLRARCRISAIVSRLERMALGELNPPMTMSEIASAKIILAKCLPDLIAVRHAGNVNVTRVETLTDADLLRIAVGMSPLLLEAPESEADTAQTDAEDDDAPEVLDAEVSELG